MFDSAPVVTACPKFRKPSRRRAATSECVKYASRLSRSHVMTVLFAPVEVNTAVERSLVEGTASRSPDSSDSQAARCICWKVLALGMTAPEAQLRTCRSCSTRLLGTLKDPCIPVGVLA